MLSLAMVGMQQVHGNTVTRVYKSDDGKIMENCDALISNDPQVTLSVRVADCLPISVIDKKSRSIGLIHAGWRELDKSIISKTVEIMVKEFSVDPTGFEVLIGPHICQKHYEVKEDVSSKFREWPGTVLKKDDKEFLDLGKIAELQLIAAGVPRKNIKTDKTCTFEDLSLSSFRRDKTSERMVITLSLT